MKDLNQDIITFSTTQFAFIKQKLEGYLLVIIGNNLLKKEVEIELKNFDENRGFIKGRDISAIGIIKKENLPDFQKELKFIQQKIDFSKSFYSVLIQYKSSLLFEEEKTLPSEEAFLISAKAFIQFYENDISTGLCYDFMLKALNKETGIEQVLVHQMGHPNPTIAKTLEQKASAEVIMPHLGDLNDLESALWHLNNQNVIPNRVSVCFDEPITDNHFELTDNHNANHFFANFPSQVGPYVSRDILARGSEAEVIVFHDSDDISTLDRVAILTDTLNNQDWDAVGSHELRISKVEKIIQAVRFPVDTCLLYTSPSPRDRTRSRMPSSA